MSNAYRKYDGGLFTRSRSPLTLSGIKHSHYNNKRKISRNRSPLTLSGNNHNHYNNKRNIARNRSPLALSGNNHNHYNNKRNISRNRSPLTLSGNKHNYYNNENNSSKTLNIDHARKIDNDDAATEINYKIDKSKLKYINRVSIEIIPVEKKVDKIVNTNGLRRPRVIPINKWLLREMRPIKIRVKALMRDNGRIQSVYNRNKIVNPHEKKIPMKYDKIKYSNSFQLDNAYKRHNRNGHQSHSHRQRNWNDYGRKTDAKYYHRNQLKYSFPYKETNRKYERTNYANGIRLGK